MLLGPEGPFTNNPFEDAGNNLLIDESGNLYFAGGASLVKVEIVERATATATPAPEPVRLFVSPNPTDGNFTVRVDTKALGEVRLSLVDQRGRVVVPARRVRRGRLFFWGKRLPAGVYFVRATTAEGRVVTERMVIGSGDL